MAIREKITKMDCIKNKNAWISKNYHKQIQKTNDKQGRNIFNSYHRQKAYFLKHKELLQIIRKKSKYLIETKATTKQFTEKEMSNHIHNTNVEIKTSLR